MSGPAVSVTVSDDSLLIEGKSPTRLAWERFRRDRAAVTASFVVIFFVCLALFAPWVCKALGINPLTLDRKALNDFGLPNGPFGAMSRKHLLGVEPGTGRDILARLIYGARISLFVGFISTLLTTVIGVVLGIVAGYRRGKIDAVISRFTDLTLAFPSLLLIIALTRPFTQRLESLGVPEGNPARLTYIILVLSLFGWVYVARIVRGQTLALREREFVEAARASGAGHWHMVFKELLPNIWAPIIVIVSLSLPGYVAVESTLSFLGVGLLPPDASWGVMLGDSVKYYRADPTYLFVPGVALIVLVLAFNVMGDGIRDALDPKSDRQQLG